jgi:putative ABC transport system ATP-binding protein
VTAVRQPAQAGPASAGAGLAVRCDNLVHDYGTPGSEVAALRGVDLTVRAGEMVALLGPSGAGKTTLLWHLAGLLRPTAGRVEVNGRQLAELSGRALARFRLADVGLLLQNPGRNVLPYQSALGNLLFAQGPARRRPAAKRRGASDLLEQAGLATVARRRAGRLSSGEQQRLALALVNEPALLLADEPTTQLDPASAAAVIELIQAANAGSGTTVVAVTPRSGGGRRAGPHHHHPGRPGRRGRPGRAGVRRGRPGWHASAAPLT